MSNINNTHSNLYEINEKYKNHCAICYDTIKQIKKEYGGNGVYCKAAFIKHLKQKHNIGPEDYFEVYCNIIRPICKCGICEQKTDFIKSGSKWFWSKYKCGRYPGQQKWSREAKESRKGRNNPMYGINAWNKGLTKENNEILKSISNKHIGKLVSEQTKIKQSESAKNRQIHGHTGIKHSEESKEKMRQNTLLMIKQGKFKQNKSKCYLEFKKILEELNILFEEEYKVNYWSIDFWLKDYNIFIEVDGDYWHSNPKFYPNGPKTHSQKINKENDVRKNHYFNQHNLILYRFWECDILNNPQEIKDILCKLKKSLQSNT